MVLAKTSKALSKYRTLHDK